MSDGYIRYDRMVENALRGVVRAAVGQAVETGLPGDHHFYITFATTAIGVDIPTYLRERYPVEMTIVLQHQYFGLSVDEEAMSVTLSFSGKQERLRIPLSAITTFADPSVNFALQFQAVAEADEERHPPSDGAAATASDGGGSGGPAMTGLLGPAAQPAAPEPDQEGDNGDDDNVITLDRFRKK